MQLGGFPLIIFVASLSSATFIPFISVIKTSFAIIEKLENIWEKIDKYSDLFEPKEETQENLIFEMFDNINMHLVDIDQRLGSIDRRLSMIVRLLENIPGKIRLEFILHDIHNIQMFIDTYYNNFKRYAMDFDQYENATLMEFGNSLVSNLPNSVPNLIATLHLNAINRDFLHLLFDKIQVQPEGYSCTEQNSPQQILLGFINEIILVHTKSYILEQAAYAMKIMYRQGAFKAEIQESKKMFQKRVKSFVEQMIPYVSQASLEHRRCDPFVHVPGQTYIALTNFLHGFILNKANIDPLGDCNEECEAFQFVKRTNCGDNTWCKQQNPCTNIHNCRYADSAMTVCTSDTAKTNRRYEYVELQNGKKYGNKNGCPKGNLKHLETYRYWLVWKCSYCVCVCDEGTKFYSEKFVNMRLAMANVTDNRVVVGLRFVKVNRIIHLQIKEGKLFAEGRIDPGTLRWVPVDNYKRTDRYVYEGQDYHTVSWERRGFELHDVKAPPNHVITGVRFKRIGTRLDWEVLTAPFNITTGQLDARHQRFVDEDALIKLKHKFKKELRLHRPDVPIRCKMSTDVTTNVTVEFTHTDFEKDAAQTTIPFFDAQPVEATVPLSGIGIYHKGAPNCGGFIAPRIFTYDFSHLMERIISTKALERDTGTN